MLHEVVIRSALGDMLCAQSELDPVRRQLDLGRAIDKLARFQALQREKALERKLRRFVSAAEIDMPGAAIDLLRAALLALQSQMDESERDLRGKCLV
jgi:hypothetical protein